MRTFAAKTRGFTIIEFMIAGTLGLILLAGLMMMFLSSQQTSRSTRAQIDVQNEGRFAMRFVTDLVQQAGWTRSGLKQPNMYSALLQGGLTNLAEDSTSGTTVGEITLAASDRIAVQYEGAVDCNGTADADGVVTDTFSVLTSGSTPALACNNETIVNNVESFQVLYAISDNPDLPGNRLQWVNASGVTNLSAVRAVKIELLLASQDISSDMDISRQFTVGDEAAITRNDRRLHQVFSSTIELKNVLR